MYSPQTASRPATPHGVPNSSTERSNVEQSSNQERLMQVKVLYTFDDSNKSNCLVRCPQPLSIRTAFLDQTSEIGIIPLRSCIQAIVAASPELIAKLGHDYTVYAYDYSEYETPLVGQGMLSWVLASASTTPMAPAENSRTMVTGRVCNNLLGLFSPDGVKETLEVKLRLVPVPTCLQSEYLEGMERYRDASNLNLAGEGFDADAWTTFLRANPNFGQDAPSPRDAPNYTMDRSLPTFNSNASGNGEHGQQHAHAMNIARLEKTDVLGRSTTPSGQNQPSRPSSRASNRGRQLEKPRARAASRVDSVQNQESTDVEDGPSRKRARTTKADWQGPSLFVSTADSLRVTASTAASIRGHRLSMPTTTHPTASELAAGEHGQRPPTPRPKIVPRKIRCPRPTSSLARDLTLPRSDSYVSPYAFDAEGSAFTSPEKVGGSVGSTPADMPSSPPVPLHRYPTPSSPALPMLPDHQDSGFVSGTLDEYMQDEEDELRPLDEEDIEMAARYKPIFPVPPGLLITQVVPGDPTLLPVKILPRPPVKAPPRPKQPRKRKQPALPEPSSPRLPPLLPLPESNYQSDQVEMPPISEAESAPPAVPRKVERPIKRSESYMSDSAAPQLDSSTGLGDLEKSSRMNSGSSLKRKKAIQDRLTASIQAGEEPPFCANCGEIDTPTWRKAFTKIESGSPNTLEVSENEEGILGWEAVTKDDGGEVTSYKVIRKTLKAEDQGFEEVQFCNPCGIYLYKHRITRPAQKWTKSLQPAEAPKPKRRPSRKKDAQAGSTGLQSEADQQQCTSTSTGASSNPLHIPQTQAQSNLPLPPTGSYAITNKAARRSNSMSIATHSTQPNSRSSFFNENVAAAALRKAIQSSPPRFPGSRHSPIELDDEMSPEPIRRLLFPSPRREGEKKLLDGPCLDGFNPVDSGETIAHRHGHGHGPRQGTEEELEDKENQPPRMETGDGQNTLHDLSEGTRESPNNAAGAPQTPPHSTTRLSEDENRFKTPTPSSSSKYNRKVLTEKDFMSSGGNSRSSRSCQQLLQTPSRAVDGLFNGMGFGGGMGMEQMTPFTAQLTQLISEANYPAQLDNDFDAEMGGDLFGRHLAHDVHENEAFDFGHDFGNGGGIDGGSGSKRESDGGIVELRTGMRGGMATGRSSSPPLVDLYEDPVGEGGRWSGDEDGRFGGEGDADIDAFFRGGQ